MTRREALIEFLQNAEEQAFEPLACMGCEMLIETRCQMMNHYKVCRGSKRFVRGLKLTVDRANRVIEREAEKLL